MEKNIQLLKDTLEWLKNKPEQHRQTSFINFFDDEDDPDYESPNMCHTTMCTAGHAAALAGAEIPKHNWHSEWGWSLDDEGKLVKYDGLPVEFWAREKLGFNYNENEYIFYCMSDRVVLKRIEQLIRLWEDGQSFDPDVHHFINEHD